MHQVQLADDLYKQAQRRAAEAGYSSVDQYVAEVVTDDLSDETENLDHLFTPEVVARLDQISEDMKLDKSVSAEEVHKHLADVREAWLKDHAS